MCRPCDNEEESYEHLWLRCPAFPAERQRLDLGTSLNELARLPERAQALLRIILGVKKKTTTPTTKILRLTLSHCPVHIPDDEIASVGAGGQDVSALGPGDVGAAVAPCGEHMAAHFGRIVGAAIRAGGRCGTRTGCSTARKVAVRVLEAVHLSTKTCIPLNFVKSIALVL